MSESPQCAPSEHGVKAPEVVSYAPSDPEICFIGAAWKLERFLRVPQHNDDARPQTFVCLVADIYSPIC